MKTLEDILKSTTKNGDCLEWNKCLNSDGYARMYWNGSSNGKVHRIVYELVTKENIEGRVVRHICDNPKCINPEHLTIGTQSDNVKDRENRNRTFKKITKELIEKVTNLLKTGLLTQKEISKIVGIDPRRVSDINCGRYNEEGKLTRYLQED